MPSKEQIKIWAKRTREKSRTYLNGLKASPCMDCGRLFPPCAMDFDHVRGEKKFTIGNGLRSKTQMEIEIGKCDLICSNCHRIRTQLRRKGNK